MGKQFINSYVALLVFPLLLWGAFLWTQSQQIPGTLQNNQQKPIQSGEPSVNGYLEYPQTVPPPIDAGAVLELVNKERYESGLDPLSWQADLCPVAFSRLPQIQEEWSHRVFEENGVPLVLDLGYSGAGENLSRNYYTPPSIVRAWVNSPTHKANILDTRFIDTCIAESNGHVVQIFAGY